jgi:uncharacterized membrane protein
VRSRKTVVWQARSLPHPGRAYRGAHRVFGRPFNYARSLLSANLHLLFWLSLFPFNPGWMGESRFTAVRTSLYAGVLLIAAIAYYLLQQSIIRAQAPNSILKKAVGRDWKCKLSPALFIVAILAARRSARSPGLVLS